ncbi:hypothetical protein SS209_00741 [Salmonella enterica subsp. enterica serovar Senftenberg str. SS209]|nr:hypothetical protein SS209_00741 [Salmonella enterica subsp. enterica serovar Senftenberg str. SS209]
MIAASATSSAPWIT